MSLRTLGQMRTRQIFHIPEDSTNAIQRFYTKKNMTGHKRFHSNFERDLIAMRKVWDMLKEGSIRWFGEVGRQY